MNQSESQPQKIKSNLYVFIVQDDQGRNIKLFTDSNYDNLWYKGTAEAKAVRGWWSIFNINGQFVDGNFQNKVVSESK